MKFLGIAAAVAALSGCATTIVPTVNLVAKYDEQQAITLLKDGTNTIKGNAFMRQRGGGVVTCAGSPVFLVPATDYATERVTVLYGNATGGVSIRNALFNPDYPSYAKNAKRTICDSSGNFQFDKVADGSFFAGTHVTWTAGTVQGGGMMSRAVVKDGQTISLVMAN